MQEVDLYAPVKSLLETQDFEVKSEVLACDVVGQHADGSLVIVELKLAFSLDLVLQGIDRLALCDAVYLAIPKPDTKAKRKNWRSRKWAIVNLCRRVGLGLIMVDIEEAPDGRAVVLQDPVAYVPRRNAKRVIRLQKEFRSRKGDPNQGGATRTKIITAYRQDALTCAGALVDNNEISVAELREKTGVSRAASILQKNHYGWFVRIRRGVYGLTPDGVEAVRAFREPGV